MAKFDYDYDYDDEPKWPKRFRIILIFVVIAAITAGVIYLLVPTGAGEPETTPGTPPTLTDNSSGMDDNGNGAGVTETPDTGSDDSPLPVADNPEDAKELPDAGSDTKTSGRETETGEELPDDTKPDSSAEPPPTVEPEKGVPWIGDPPPEEDQPEVIPAPPLSAGDAERLREAERKLADRDYPGAAKLAAEALATLPPGSEYGREFGDILSSANWEACVNRTQLPGVTETHLVRAGDSLSRLAVKYHTTVEALRILNQLKGDTIMVGQKLFVVPGPWRIEVRKGERRLYLYREPAEGESRLFLVFDVGIGRMGKTPTASFVISARLRHPDWYAPDGGIYKYGEKENILGDYFLKLAASGNPGRPLRGFGIHGSPEGVDVTRSLSNGCIRMRNADVEKIYLLSPNRTPVGFVD